MTIAMKQMSHYSQEANSISRNLTVALIVVRHSLQKVSWSAMKESTLVRNHLAVQGVKRNSIKWVIWKVMKKSISSITHCLTLKRSILPLSIPPPYLGTWVRIMKRWVRMVVVKVVVVCILKYNHFYYCYYDNPYPELHNPNPNPQVPYNSFQILPPSSSSK